MIEEKFKPGTPQNCVFNNGLYQLDGICEISEKLMKVDCIYLDTSRTEKRMFHDQKTDKIISMLCYGCIYQKEK